VVKKINDLFVDTRKALLAVEDPERATMVTRNLLAHVTGKSQSQLLADRDMYVGDEVCAAMDAAVARLLAGEPLAYVLGEWDFYGMTLYVDHNVLIPRDDTVAVTELAIKTALFLDEAPRILDLCTGSGCIGLAIASRVRDARITLADISKDALAVAKKNITAQHQTGRVMAVQADALGKPTAFLGKFDMIISNPPYIDTKDMGELDTSVKDYEPHLALHGGSDGLDFYRSIAANYAEALKPGGFLCFEFGDGQGDDVCAILEANGYTILERSNDYNGVERAVLAQRKED
jgi:release factor glutamine methyltransferase